MSRTEKEQKVIDKAEKSNQSNIGLDIAVWLGGIVIGLIPSILTNVFLPKDMFIHLNNITRCISDVEIVYSFLSAVAILTIEQYYTEATNAIIEKKRIKILTVFMIIEICGLVFYAALHMIPYETIITNIGGNYLEANKFVIACSVIVSISLLIIHSLPNSKNI